MERWSLTPEPPFPGASVSWVAPVTLPDGREAVLKLLGPDAEADHETSALRHWAGNGAARVLADDPGRRALLLERLRPGTQLWEEPDEVALRVFVDVLTRLHGAPPPGGPFTPLEHVARRWADELPRRYGDDGRDAPAVEEAVAFLRDVEPPARPVLLHQDLHGGNVLRADDGWRAIDPKPLAGDAAFDLASAVRDRRPALLRDPAPRRTLLHRAAVLADGLGLDAERVRGWALVHALAWGIDGGTGARHEDLIACAHWLAGPGDR